MRRTASARAVCTPARPSCEFIFIIGDFSTNPRLHPTPPHPPPPLQYKGGVGVERCKELEGEREKELGVVGGGGMRGGGADKRTGEKKRGNEDGGQ